MKTLFIPPAEHAPIHQLEKQQANALYNDKPLVAAWYGLEQGIARHDPDLVDQAQINFAIHAIKGATYDNSLLEGGTVSAHLALIATPAFRARAEQCSPNKETSEAYYAALGTLAVDTAQVLPEAIESMTLGERRVAERLGTMCTFATLRDKGFDVFPASSREMKGSPSADWKPYHDLYTLEVFDKHMIKVPIVTTGRGNAIFSEDLGDTLSMRLPFSRLIERAQRRDQLSMLGIRGSLLALGRSLRQDTITDRQAENVALLSDVGQQKYESYKRSRISHLRSNS